MHNKKTMKNISATWLLLLVIISSCLKKSSEKGIPVASDTIPVKTIAVEKKEIDLPLVVSGQFKTDDETFLSFKTGGILNGMLVNEGDYVKKGQVLATLDLTEISAQVSQAELGMEKAKRDFLRVENLYKDSVATLEQYQNSKTAIDVAKATLNSARFNLEYSKIVAVTEGYILKKFVNVGQIVGPGTPIFQSNGAGKKTWKLRASLSDKEWSTITLNDEAEVSTEAFPGEVIKGVVLSKSKGTDPSTGTFFIEIEIKNPIHDLATGLYGKALITHKNKMSFWSVPYEALLEGNAGEGFVFITNDNKIAKKVRVSISSIGKNEIYVSNGLEKASYLVVSGSAYLTDGSLIKVLKN